MLRAIPDLMFVLLRDGTYVDYHARDPKLLFVDPDALIGRRVKDVLPPELAAVMTDAFERAFQTDDPVVVEYELPMGEPRFFEARIVQFGGDRLLSIVRDVTEAKRAAQLNRDLARRLISRQEIERQRIARELHDDVSQRMALMINEIDAITAQVESEGLRARLRKLYGQAGEIALDVHHLAYELHPSRLRSLGLVAALQSLCRDALNQRHLHVVFTHGPIPPSIDENVSLSVYRIVQEALHNIARHSQASDAQVGISSDGRHLELRVADSGVGFDPAQVEQAGLGLVSMRERVAALNGQLTIDAAPGNGTRITVRIPVAAPAGADWPPASGGNPNGLSST
jgi:signal transduction histidine kinase